jgi:hypothetical protein
VLPKFKYQENVAHEVYVVVAYDMSVLPSKRPKESPPAPRRAQYTRDDGLLILKKGLHRPKEAYNAGITIHSNTV